MTGGTNTSFSSYNSTSMFFVGIVWCLIPASKILNRHLLMILKITDTPFFFVLLYFTSLFIYLYILLSLFDYSCPHFSREIVPFFWGNGRMLHEQRHSDTRPCVSAHVTMKMHPFSSLFFHLVFLASQVLCSLQKT